MSKNQHIYSLFVLFIFFPSASGQVYLDYLSHEKFKKMRRKAMKDAKEDFFAAGLFGHWLP
ncbi:MAG: hypothetical protein QF743_02635 [Candidatus Marinimicrobia bacterium]|jgi:hypothetical protein|nr:hypothetical protein [Candidatus Neomarinimicrobiota bacterium]MDP6611455.1 hypothetical protein [Candidatus Neomarinimicrobiota bacterium]|tara:strand:+ start:291 stop:473 length:183 start_codon:yes stop_codon:yes gene_type:complete